MAVIGWWELVRSYRDKIRSDDGINFLIRAWSSLSVNSFSTTTSTISINPADILSFAAQLALVEPSARGRSRNSVRHDQQRPRPLIMNLALIDPFILAQDYPDTLTSKLSMCSLAPPFGLGKRHFNADTGTLLGCGHATSLCFNRRGDFLASGRV